MLIKKLVWKETIAQWIITFAFTFSQFRHTCMLKAQVWLLALKCLSVFFNSSIYLQAHPTKTVNVFYIFKADSQCKLSWQIWCRPRKWIFIFVKMFVHFFWALMWTDLTYMGYIRVVRSHWCLPFNEHVILENMIYWHTEEKKNTHQTYNPGFSLPYPN